MSESNNNIPMRITQLEEAIAYEKGSVLAFARSGGGTKRVYEAVPSDAVIKANDGFQTFFGLANFQHYGINMDGSFVTSQKYRVSNDNPISFDEDILIKINNGFRWGYIPFIEGSAGTWSGWKTEDYNMPAGTSFVIQIARETEVTSEVANVEEFATSLYFYSKVGEKIETVIPDEPHEFLPSECMQGTWENGKVYPANNRICVKHLFYVQSGNYVTVPDISSSNIQILVGVFEKGSPQLIFNSLWIENPSNKKIEIPVNGFLFIQFRKADGSSITPSELPEDIFIHYGYIEILKEQQKAASITKNVADYEWVQGTINPNGSESSDAARIRTDDFIPNSWQQVVLFDWNFQYGIHFYDKNRNHISNTSWIGSSSSIEKVPNCEFIKLVFSRKNGSAIVPTDAQNVINLESSLKDSYLETQEKVFEIEEELFDNKKPYSYIGEKIPTGYGFNYEKILRMSYSEQGLTSQDIDIIGDYLFVAFSGTEQIRVYSISEKSLLASMEIETEHGSGMQFSNEYYEEGDDFPLLYVGGWIDNLIQVIRITKSENVWSAEIVRTLYIPTSEGYFMAPSVDNENNILYCYGYTDDSVEVTGNKMVLLKCDLSDLTDNGDGTYTPDILSRIETPYLGIMQGRKYYNNRLYIGFAETSSPHNSRIVVVDVSNGETKTIVDMTPVTTSENEGICYKIEQNKISWFFSEYYDVFKIYF